jgi:hypothetical protein
MARWCNPKLMRDIRQPAVIIISEAIHPPSIQIDFRDLPDSGEPEICIFGEVFEILIRAVHLA